MTADTIAGDSIMHGQPADLHSQPEPFLDAGITEAFAKVVVDDIGRDLPSPHHATNSHALLHEVHGPYQTLYRAAAESLRAADRFWADAERLSRDDTIPPAGRARLMDEARQKAERDVDGLADQADTAALVLERDLTAAALPPAPRTDREMLARDTVRMLADPVPAHEAVARLTTLAGGSDLEAAAVVTGPFGRAYLEARGLDNREAAEAHEGIVAAAIRAALDSTDARRSAAARVLRSGAVGKLTSFARYSAHAVSTQKLPATVG